MVDRLASNRLNGIGEYYFSQKLREIDELRKAGHNILNLGIGSPDLRPPKQVEEAIIEELKEANYHQYQSYKGLPELRAAFSNWYQRHFQTALDYEKEILPLMGSKEGIMHACMALLNPEDKVLIPNPGYPTYAAAAKLAGAEIIPYELIEKNHYFPDFKEIASEDLSKVKMMWVNYPHMPTGADSNDVLFDELLQFSRRHGIVVINDNPYGFILTSQRRSLLKNRLSSDLVLELNSLSKSHNMSGWRIGMLAGNPELLQAILTFKSNMDSGQFKPIMKASIAALNVEDAWYDEQNIIYRRRRERVFDIAKRLGCTYDPNQVGMFVWARIPDTYADGKVFADYLLEKYQVFVPPGSVFGSAGDHFIRFSLCSDLTVWEEVINRIMK